MLTAAWGCLEEGELGRVRTVFASRHGASTSRSGCSRGVRARAAVARAFSHTVHNAQAGLFSIAAQNRAASSSLAARADTFACGWLEALAHLERDPARRCCYVIADVQLAPRFAALVDEPEGSYALALLVAREGDGPQLRFDSRAERRRRYAVAARGRILALAARGRGTPVTRTLPLDALLGGNP